MTTLTTGPRARRNRAHRNGGFTLIELVLVMVIICTVLAMASPSMRGFFASRRTADASAQIVALTRYARDHAVADGSVYRMNLDAGQGTYWLTAQKGGIFERIASEFGREFNLPDGTTAEWLEPSGAEWIAFYPDGRGEAAHIRLTGRQGETADIVCAAPAERFHVVYLSEGEAP